MKKIICLALLLVMLFSLTSCVVSEKYDYDMTKYITIPTINGHVIDVELDYVQATIDNYLLSSAKSSATKYAVQEGETVRIILTFTQLKYIDEAQTVDQRGDVILTTDPQAILNNKDKESTKVDSESVKTDSRVITSDGKTYIEITLGGKTGTVDSDGDGVMDKVYDLNADIEKKFLKKKLGQEHNDIYTMPDAASLASLPEAFAPLKEYAGQKVYMTYQVISKPVAEGDVINAKYTGYYIDDDGNIALDDKGKEKTFDSGTSAFFIGSHLAIDDFEKGFIGANIDEEVSFYATFPDDYQSADLKGKKVMFKGTVKTIYDVPEYDLDFVKATFGDFESLEAFETSLKETYAAEKILEYLVTKSVVLDYPRAEYKIIERQLEDIEIDFATQYSMSLDTYITQNLGMADRDAYIKYSMLTEMAYYAYAQQNNLVPTEKDIATARDVLIATYKAQYLEDGGSNITEDQALAYATSFVDEGLEARDLHQEALYAMVADHIETQYVMNEKPTTYTSVTRGGSYFDDKAE